jgi:hypothetical protein
MITRRLAIPLFGFLILGSSAPGSTATDGDEVAAQKAADKKFDQLLVAAQKDPAKADWKALRHAYSATSGYKPYSATWQQDIAKVGEDFQDGQFKKAEAAIVELLKREKFMRLDGHAMAIAIYEKLGDTEKARKHQDFLEGLTSVVMIPGHGASFEKPIEILFIEEEYLVLGSLGVKVKQQALTERDGRRFDVLTTRAMPGKPERQLYFNIDMPWKALQSSMIKDVDVSKESAPKK